MNNQIFNCHQAKQIELVSYLNHLGFQPEKIVGDDYWYLSPLRDEKHASFKVNGRKNVWYDFGTGEGGDIIDFGIRYHHCSVAQFLEQLKNSFSFHPPVSPKESCGAGQKKKTRVIATAPIINPALCRYLADRRIPLDVARQYCREVHYELDGRHYFALGFPNNSGGYELRNKYFKGCVAPKDFRLITVGDANSVAVFEGFFSFLSFLIGERRKAPGTCSSHNNYLILNSLSFFDKCRSLMESHNRIFLFLDRDKAGIHATQGVLGTGPKYKDMSHEYAGYKDFNEMLIRQNQDRIHSRKVGRRL